MPKKGKNMYSGYGKGYKGSMKKSTKSASGKKYNKRSYKKAKA